MNGKFTKHSLFTVSIIGFSILSVVFSGCSQNARNDQETHSYDKVIFLVIDSLRYDHIHAHGYERETTPWMDELIGKSADFSFAISPSNVTTNSVPAYFTGKPVSHFFDPHAYPMWIPEEETTLAETFLEGGYETYIWSTNPHLKKKGFSQGFNHQFITTLTHHKRLTIEDIIRGMDREYKSSTKPEFHYIHTMDVHFPYLPPYPYDRAFADHSYERDVVKNGSPTNLKGELAYSTHPFLSEDNDISDEDVQFIKDIYDGTIRYTDDYVPKMLDALDYNPEKDLLIITADHGEQLFAHKWWDHSKLLFTQEIHVPLIVHSPDFPAHKIEGAVSLLDLYPTLCELLDLPKPEGLFGKSIVPALKGGTRVNGLVYSEARDIWEMGGAVMNDEYLYFFQADQTRLHPWKLWPFNQTLIDLKNDPECLEDLSGEQPERLAQMHKTLKVINPRWAPYAREILPSPKNGMKTSENKFDLENAAWLSSNLGSAELKNTKTLNSKGQGFALNALLENPDATYQLSFDYEVVKGGFELELLDALTGKSLWTYAVLKESDTPRKFSCRIHPGTIELKCVLRLNSEETEINFANPVFREIPFPKIVPKPADGVYNAGASEFEDTMTESEKQTLKSLGYFE
jgi:arylsulfatase A-like enzyme